MNFDSQLSYIVQTAANFNNEYSKLDWWMGRIGKTVLSTRG